ncbi:MAG TPA: DUF3080 domain-containing protein [Marinobacter sp.]|uniref:DUF3080 domain-containing protein n=1 Tax=Marinobacter antarcticus TaxID=564117 RepID=A0A831R4M5_9GAMM|nr:DUF3080 domain-containing protein [Marinobacter antarcticus]HDZ38732.1 DUF3080 domain-containing protein [Marinobacter sp.]HEA53045.1 DUF3080 domain-containing protein [Marinobacter antarcticus]
MSGTQSARLLVSGLIVFLLAGCNPFSEARPMMDEYVERVGRVLDIEPEFSEIPPAEPIPRRRNRVLPMPELELGMLDFLSLYGCELQYVVGEKNSIMGKVMQPLNRLRYEVHFIRAAGDCLDTVEDKGLQGKLRKAIASKRESLPIAVWNATWGVEEVETLFTLAKGEYPVEAKDLLSDLSRNARQLNTSVVALLGQNLNVDLGFWGKVHQRWQAEYRAGQLVNSAKLVTARLRDATELIDERLGKRPLCLNGKPNSQSDIVQSMFFSIYIGKIQPYLADLRRARTDLIEPLSELAAMQSDVMPVHFQDWYQSTLALKGRKSIWSTLDAAVKSHTKGWQTLLEQCGLRPGA